jgi:cell division protease FtsH
MSNQPPVPSGPGGPASRPAPTAGLGLWLLLGLGLLAVLFYAQSLNLAHAQPADYSRFREAVRADVVQKVVIGETEITGDLKPGATFDGVPAQFAVVRPSGNLEGDLTDLLEKHGVAFKCRQPSSLFNLLAMLAMPLLLVLFMFGSFRRFNPAERALAFGKSRAKQQMETGIKVRFDDVAGIEEPKAELVEILDYLRDPGRFRRLGGRIPRGVLLVGAPGTGKTLLAKAVAGEAEVPFFSMSGSDFMEMFVGVGASRVRDLFAQAQSAAGSRGCIIFIDELDALGKARGVSPMSGAHDEREQTLNQLLVEMDGFDTKANVIVMAATNRPEILDPALLRPGRFDRQIVIPPPDIVGREAILKVHAAKIKTHAQLDLRRVAGRTPGFVGADLANVCNEAALLAARRGRDSVTFEDFDEAIDRVSIGLERRSQVMNDEEKKIVAYHEAGHAITAAFCPHADPVHKVTIIPRGLAGGVTVFARENDRHLYAESTLRDYLVTMLGGRAAEELTFGQVSTGPANDLKQVTALARAMVVEYGMSPELGPLNYESGYRQDPYGFAAFAGGRQFGEATTERVDAEVRRLVDEANARAKQILTDHAESLERLAARLLEVETVDRGELYEMLGLPCPAEERRRSGGEAEPSL